MELKKIGLSVILVIIILPMVFSLEESIIKTKITVTYDNSTSNLRIKGENLDWSKTINNTNFNFELEIFIARTLANLTEYTEKMELCADQLNFTRKWKECIDLNTKLDIQNRQMINESVYAECLTNITNIQHKCELDLIDKGTLKQKEIDTAVNEKEKIEFQRSLLMIALGLSIAGLIFKEKILGKFRRGTPFTEREPITDQRM